MFKKSGLLTFYAETSLHMGSGTSLSYVDLPIQREKHTDFPIMQASGIKGVIREFAERQWKDDKTKVEVIFGPKEGDKFASCIVFTDAKILLFPVRSVSGIFAWVASPFILKRFKRDLESAGIEFKDNNEEINIPEPSGEEKIIVATNSILKVQNTSQVMLEEFVFDVEDGGKSEQANKIANKIKGFLPQNSAFQDLINEFPARFCIVADNVFKDFVKLAVEIQTRIKIDQTTGIVKEGALFTEELVPSESVFYSLVFFNDPYFGLKEDLRKEIENFYKSQKPWEEVVKSQEVKDKGWDSVKEEVKKYVKEAYQKKYLKAEYFCDLQNSLFNSLNLLQLGGDETLGRGFLRVKFTKGGHNENN